MKAIWNNVVVAESDDTEVVEGNHYFPKETVHSAYIEQSTKTSICHWKGTASYYTLSVNGETNPDAAWYYPEPKEGARAIRNRIAFWKGVKVVE